MSGIRAARRIVQAAQQVLRLAAQVVKHLVKQIRGTPRETSCGGSGCAHASG